MNSEEIARIVGEVLKRLEGREGRDDVMTALRSAPEAAPAAQPLPVSSAPADGVLFSSVDAAVQAAVKAQAVFQEQGLETRREVIRAMRKTAVANAEKLAKMAVEETGMGRAADKVQKNLVCATRTPG